MGKQVSVSAPVAATPAAVFGLVTDIASLPRWNAAITEVVELPAHLEIGSQWKVKLHALGQSWVSKSQVSAIDPATGRFAYRSQSDDGNGRVRQGSELRRRLRGVNRLRRLIVHRSLSIFSAWSRMAPGTLSFESSASSFFAPLLSPVLTSARASCRRLLGSLGASSCERRINSIPREVSPFWSRQTSDTSEARLSVPPEERAVTGVDAEVVTDGQEAIHYLKGEMKYLYILENGISTFSIAFSCT